MKGSPQAAPRVIGRVLALVVAIACARVAHADVLVVPRAEVDRELAAYLVVWFDDARLGADARLIEPSVRAERAPGVAVLLVDTRAHTLTALRSGTDVAVVHTLVEGMSPYAVSVRASEMLQLPLRVTAVETGEDLGRPGAGGAGTQGAGTQGAGTQDGGTQDGGTQDGGTEDAGVQDAGVQDAGAQDGGTQEAGTQGAGTQGAGTQDAVAQDGGTQEAGTQDGGTQDAGPEPGGRALGPSRPVGLRLHAGYTLSVSTAPSTVLHRPHLGVDVVLRRSPSLAVLFGVAAEPFGRRSRAVQSPAADTLELRRHAVFARFGVGGRLGRRLGLDAAALAGIGLTDVRVRADGVPLSANRDVDAILGLEATLRVALGGGVSLGLGGGVRFDVDAQRYLVRDEPLLREGPLLGIIRLSLIWDAL